MLLYMVFTQIFSQFKIELTLIALLMDCPVFIVLCIYAGSLQYLDSELDWTMDMTLDSHLFYLHTEIIVL